MISLLRLILNNDDFRFAVGSFSLDSDTMTTTLDQLRPGQSGEIARVEGCDGISCRLREMGFVPGEVVRFLNAAPLGDPLNCIIQGSRVALRGREARRISLVSPVPVDATVAVASGQSQGLNQKRPSVDPIAV